MLGSKVLQRDVKNVLFVTSQWANQMKRNRLFFLVFIFQI